MNLVDELGPFLPYVRRFAAALTGAQSTGDAYVRRSLQLLNAGVLQLGELQPKLALYRLLIETIDLGPVLSHETEAWRDAPRNTPPLRAFLLTALENFMPEEAASILGVSDGRVRRLLEEGRMQLEANGNANVLVIEDEPVIALEIAQLVSDLGKTVVGVAATQREAVELARGKRIDLILADIQLADGSSGMDAVQDIRDSAAQPCPVIFVTAFPERLLQGVKPEPSFLITKPFWPATVRAAVGQALFFGRLDDEARVAS
jgi:CheY-like chemotaxis protein